MGISLKGKCAIITGAANGVGLAIARRFLIAGANVVLSDMDEENLIKETNFLKETIEGNVLTFCGDLRKKLTINNLLAYTIDSFNSVDILINASRQVLTSHPLDPNNDAFEELKYNVLAKFEVMPPPGREKRMENPDANWWHGVAMFLIKK